MSLTKKSPEKEKPENGDSSDSDIKVLHSEEGDSFEFHPLQLNHRKTISQRVSVILRKTEMAHSQVGEKLYTREPRVSKVKGDGNCLFPCSVCSCNRMGNRAWENSPACM